MQVEVNSELAAVREEAAKCNLCGFCQAACPVYRSTGHEGSAARGHHAQLQAVMRGELELGEELDTPIFERLMCRACTAHCPPAIKTDQVVAGGRAALVASRADSALLRGTFRRRPG